MIAAAVFDAWAALALLKGEGDAVRILNRYLSRAFSGNLTLSISLVNLGEVFYRMIQMVGEPEAAQRLASFRRLPLTVIQVKEALVFEAARIKAGHRLSYADAFAVATARLECATLLTGDPEILALPPSVVKVRRLVR